MFDNFSYAELLITHSALNFIVPSKIPFSPFLIIHNSLRSKKINFFMKIQKSKKLQNISLVEARFVYIIQFQS